jgi:hypothetical protein
MQICHIFGGKGMSAKVRKIKELQDGMSNVNLIARVVE